MARFGPDVIRTMGSAGGIMLLATLVNVITARGMSVDDRGLYSLAFMVVRTAVRFGGFHLAQAQIFHVGRKGLSPERVLGASLPLMGLLAASLWLLLRWAAPWLLDTFDTLEPGVLQVAIVAAPLLLLGGALTQFFRAMDRLDQFNLIRPISPMLTVIGMAGVALTQGSVRDFALVIVVAEAIYIILVLSLLLRTVRPDTKGAVANGGSLLRYGARLEVANLPAQAELHLAGFVVAYFLPIDQVALWAIGKGLSDQLTTLPTVIGAVLHPKLAGLSNEQAARMTAAACRGVIFLVGVLAVVMALGSQILVWVLFGEPYLAAAQVLVLLLPFVLSRAMVRVMSRYFVIGDHLRFLGLLNAGTLVVNLGLLVLLVPQWGITGAALATSGAHALRAAISCIAYQRLARLAYRDFLLVTADDVRWMWNQVAAPVARRIRSSSGSR